MKDSHIEICIFAGVLILVGGIWFWDVEHYCSVGNETPKVVGGIFGTKSITICLDGVYEYEQSWDLTDKWERYKEHKRFEMYNQCRRDMALQPFSASACPIKCSVNETSGWSCSEACP